MSAITTHVLDTARGRPAAGMPVLLEIQTAGNNWKEVGRGVTDGDGRVNNLMATGHLIAGVYRLTFDTNAYFLARHVQAFYPNVILVFAVSDVNQHYHVPLLLSPYSYSTYRGS
jgi:5-hydroxyisourate hydrolase